MNKSICFHFLITFIFTLIIDTNGFSNYLEYRYHFFSLPASATATTQSLSSIRRKHNGIIATSSKELNKYQNKKLSSIYPLLLFDNINHRNTYKSKESSLSSSSSSSSAYSDFNSTGTNYKYRYSYMNKNMPNEKISSRKNSFISILNAAFLISGTTIGGGFLALPTVTSQAGFYPSTITLISVWLYFLTESFILVECIERTRNDHVRDNDCGDTSSGTATSMHNDTNSIPGVSVAAAARKVFGKTGEVVIGLLLFILIEATLVSQISRAGLMFPQKYRISCIFSAISIAILVFGPKGGTQFASKANSFLTTGFILSAMAVFRYGIGNDNLDLSRLRMSSSSHFLPSTIPTIIPTFLQLLVYGEIVPSVCELLKYEIKSIRFAILIGSFLTLCLQIGWSALGISLIPPNGFINGGEAMDAVNILLESGGSVQLPLLCLATTAILTTILGSYLALMTISNDLFSRQRQKQRRRSTQNNDDKKGKEKDENEQGDEYTNDDNDHKSIIPSLSSNLRQRILSGSLITLPALSIALTSPSVFLKAIDFAGSYPVLLLWGVIPPVLVLVQRYSYKRLRSSSSSTSNLPKASSKSGGPSWWIFGLALLSLGMVGMSAKEDLVRLLQRLL
mmetsp:Transcript_26332/g.32454  ORF Transcript_26332/g.32454 Transcript_26332/m.32454 type:complete len:622 (+) Transcript_26332:76-1941(+)